MKETNSNCLCEKETTEIIYLNNGKELHFCKFCSVKVIIKDIIRISFISILIFTFLALIGSFLFTEQPPIFRYFLIWIVTGIPFGAKFMFNFIHISVTIPSITGIIAINLFLGGLIGGFIAVWRLMTAIKNLIKSILLIWQIII